MLGMNDEPQEGTEEEALETAVEIALEDIQSSLCKSCSQKTSEAFKRLEAAIGALPRPYNDVV